MRYAAFPTPAIGQLLLSAISDRNETASFREISGSRAVFGDFAKNFDSAPRPCSPFIVVSLACAVRIDLGEILDDLLERSRAARSPVATVAWGLQANTTILFAR